MVAKKVSAFVWFKCECNHIFKVRRVEVVDLACCPRCGSQRYRLL